jgi:hypothetical protein
MMNNFYRWSLMRDTQHRCSKMQKCDGMDCTDDGMHNEREPEVNTAARAVPAVCSDEDPAAGAAMPGGARGHSVTAILHFVPKLLHLKHDGLIVVSQLSPVRSIPPRDGGSVTVLSCSFFSTFTISL